MAHFMEQALGMLIPIVIHSLEAMGVIVISIAGIIAFYKSAVNLIKKEKYPIKIKFAEAMSLALEFKMGAEILKTVTVRTLDEMFILGAIILLRAILSVIIHWEIKDQNHDKKLTEVHS